MKQRLQIAGETKEELKKIFEELRGQSQEDLKLEDILMYLIQNSREAVVI